MFYDFFWSNQYYRFYQGFRTWIRGNPSAQDIENKRLEILSKQDPAAAFYWAWQFKNSIQEMESIILKCSSAQFSLAFACCFPESDQSAHEKIVIDSNDTRYIAHLAVKLKTPTAIEAAEKRLESGSVKNTKFAYWLIRDKVSKNPLRFKNLIFKSKKPRYIYEISNFLTDSQDLVKAEDLIIKSGSFMYMRLLAKNSKFNIEKLEQAVMDSGDVKQMKRFAQEIPESKMRDFLILS